MTSIERKNMLDRIESMIGLLHRVKERLKKPTEDDPDNTEYDLNRLKTAIYNFKKVQLPKITKYEKNNNSFPNLIATKSKYVK